MSSVELEEMEEVRLEETLGVGVDDMLFDFDSGLVADTDLVGLLDAERVFVVVPV